MFRPPNAMRIGLAFVVGAALLPPPVRAKEFASNRYGFQITVPAGFREQPADAANSVVKYVESDAPGGGHPTLIDIRHAGPKINPADRNAVSNLARQKGWASSLETRRWKEMDLQVLRQEISVSSTESYVNFTVMIPIKDEGVIVVVQGIKSREKEVVKVFDDSVQQFVNLKPYATVVGPAQSGEEKASLVQKLIANVLLPVTTGAIVVFWIAKVRKAKRLAAR